MKFEIWFPLMVGLGPTLIGLFALRGQYKKESADASAINVTTALKLMKKLEDKVERMGKRIDELESNEYQYVRLLRRLIKQIEEQGLVPVVTLDQVNHIAQEVHE